MTIFIRYYVRQVLSLGTKMHIKDKSHSRRSKSEVQHLQWVFKWSTTEAEGIWAHSGCRLLALPIMCKLFLVISSSNQQHVPTISRFQWSPTLGHRGNVHHQNSCTFSMLMKNDEFPGGCLIFDFILLWVLVCACVKGQMKQRMKKGSRLCFCVVSFKPLLSTAKLAVTASLSLTLRPN